MSQAGGRGPRDPRATDLSADAVRPSWVVLVLGATLFVLVLTAAAQYAREVVREQPTSPAGISTVSSSLVSERLQDGRYRISVLLLLRNQDPKLVAEHVQVSARVASAAPAVPRVLVSTVARVLPNQTTAVILRATRSRPDPRHGVEVAVSAWARKHALGASSPPKATLERVLVTTNRWLRQYPWSDPSLGSVSVEKAGEGTDPMAVRVTNTSATATTGGKLVRLAFAGQGSIAGGAEAPIPPLQPGEAGLVEVPSDGLAGDLRRELYVQSH